MKRFVLATFAVAFAWLSLAVGPAAAQNVYPFQQPRFGPGWQTPLSPYLNLLIPGNTAVNYYALVQPQFERRQYRNMTNLTLQALMNQIPEPPGIIAEEFNAPLQSTGHPTAFNYTGSYFGTLTGQSFVSEGALPQRPMGAGMGAMGAGRRPGMGGMGMGGMMGGMGGMMGGMGGMMGGMGGMMGGRGTWPNMRQ